MQAPENETIMKHLEALVGERNPFSAPGPLEQAAGYIANQFQEVGLTVSREEVPFQGTVTHNIFGLKEGTDPEAGTFILGGTVQGILCEDHFSGNYEIQGILRITGTLDYIFCW